MQSKAATVTEYLKELPADRRKALQAIRKTIKANLPKGYAEGMQYGMIGYFVPHRLYAPGYHCDPAQPLPFAGLASQKNHIGLYLFCLYCDPGEMARFQKAWRDTGTKLDMGKACIRAKALEDIPLEVLGDAVARVTVEKFIGFYEGSLPAATLKKHKARAAKQTAKTTASKKATNKTAKASKEVASKKTTKKSPARRTAKKSAKKTVRKKVVRKTAKRSA